MQPLYIMEAADVRRADVADNSRVLTLTRVVFGELKRKSVNLNPGGGIGEVSFLTNSLEPIECAFDTRGIDEDALAGFGFDGTFDKWTLAGSMKNMDTGVSVPSRAIIRGIIQSVKHDDFTGAGGGAMFGCAYTLAQVLHYELWLNNKELWYFDWFQRIGRANGNDWFQGTRNALGI